MDRHKRWCGLLCCVGVALGAVASRAEAERIEARSVTPAHLYTAPVRGDVRVDGELGEWRWDAPAERANCIAITTKTFTLNPPPVTSDADCSGVVQFAWDGRDTLYVAAVVRDQSLVSLPKSDAMPWKCDSLMVSIHAYGAARERTHLVKTTKWAAHPLFGLSAYTEKTGPRVWTKNTRYVVKPTGDGYRVEAALALRDVGYRVRTGDRLKFSLILVDHDAGGKFAQLVQPTDGPGSGDIVFAFWWDLRLRDAKPYAGEIVTSETRFRSGTKVGFTGQIDAFGKGLRLKAVRLKDRAGRVAATEPVDVPLVPGRRTVFTGRFTGLSLQPGRYRVAAVIDESGRETNGSVGADVEIVASTEATTATVGTLPDRHVVANPMRLYFPSDRRKYKPRKITKEDYIGLTKRVFNKSFGYYLKQGRKANLGIWGVFVALQAYAVYKHTGDKQYLETGLGLIRHTHEDHAKRTAAIHWPEQDRIVNLYRQDPAVGEADRKWLGEYLPRLVRQVWKKSRPTEWGAMNRSAMWAFLLDIAAKRLPNAPDVNKWKAYAELNWQSWWPFRDHWENSSDYNGASTVEFLAWAAWRNPANLKDPELVKMVEREMLEVTPAGAFPGYGDAAPWNGSCYHRIIMFERMATATRDGRFKWAARRLFDYAERQMEDLDSWGLIRGMAAGSCAYAYLYADDTVPEVVPKMTSRITRRKRVVQIPRDDPLRKELLDKYGITGVFTRMDKDEQLNKLILRAGADPFAPAAMIELCSDAGHHASTVPNLNYLMRERAVLLCDLAYTERGPEYHNVVHVEDLTGIAPDVRKETVTVPVLDVGSRATYAQVNVDNYKGWPVTNSRRVLFTHDGPVLVKDLVTFRQPFVARVRQQWQTRQLGPKAGPNWVNTCIPYIINTGLGLGSGFQRWLNPAWDLLVYFTPQRGRDYEVYDRTRENVWQALPLRVSQRYRGLPEKDKPLHFTTLLWPHKPVHDVKKVAARIRLIVDSVQVTAFRLDVTDRHCLVVGVNDTGARQTFGPVSTDARVFVLTCATVKGTVRPTHLFARDATVFSLDGKPLCKTKVKTDVDRSL